MAHNTGAGGHGHTNSSNNPSSSSSSSAAAVQRTAPIPIAPKPPSRPESSSAASLHHQHHHSASLHHHSHSHSSTSAAAAARRLDVRPGSASNNGLYNGSSSTPGNSAANGPGSSNLSNLIQARGAAAAAADHQHPAGSSAPSSASGPLPPCLACRQAGSRCIPSEDDDGCISCQVNADECSLSLSAPSLSSRKRKLFPEEDRLRYVGARAKRAIKR